MIKTLIVSGGGNRSIATLGALQELEKKGILNNIIRYAGASAGALICTLLNLGFTTSEIITCILSFNSTNIKDSFYKIPFNILFNYGLYSGDKMMSRIKLLFKQKGFDSNITFNELFIKTRKVLVITGTSLSVYETYYFNTNTSPDMKIIDALSISMCIPFLFTRVKYTIEKKVHTFVDGGLLMNFPMHYFETCDLLGKYVYTNTELSHAKCSCEIYNLNDTIGIMLLNDGESTDISDFYKGYNKITNIKSYIDSLIGTIMNKIEESNFLNPITGSKTDFFDDVIAISVPENVSTLDFNLSDKCKEELVQYGVNAAKAFFI